MSKLEITLDEIHAYLHCPAKHMFKYQKGIQGEESRSILFKKAIHKTIDYFFFSLMNSQMPTLGHLKDKWNTTYSEMLEDVQIESILSTRKGYNPKQRDARGNPEHIKGMEMLYHFYNFNKNNPGTPIAVDHEYHVEIGGVTVTGKFELVRELLDPSDGRRYIEIVDFKTSDKPLEYMLVKNDINLLFASYAFRNLFKAKEDRMKYHYLSTGKDIIINKADDNYGRVESIVKGVASGIAGGHSYPRQTFMCRSCELKDICDATKF